MKAAIIGLGNIGAALATNLAEGGAEIIVADRTFTKAEKLAATLGEGVTPMPMDAALASADVVILSVYLDAIKELVVTYRAAPAGKIVVDPSNPLGPDGKGGFKKTIPAEQSSGEVVAALLPEGTELVKAFGTLTAGSLASGARRLPEPAVLFYASDYPEAGNAVAKLITKSGFAPVRVGGIGQSLRIEVGGDLHEMGKIGKLVSAKEAAALV